ncbi:MAG: MGMT family protein [Pseudomonadota bacterium]
MSSAKSAPGNRNDRVWAVVRQIPEGRVLTYKRVAELAQISGRSGARQVGYALAQIPAEVDIPWHRVINAQGMLSPRANPDSVDYQRELLSLEGIEFGLGGKIDLEQFLWTAKKVKI